MSSVRISREDTCWLLHVLCYRRQTCLTAVFIALTREGTGLPPTIATKRPHELFLPVTIRHSPRCITLVECTKIASSSRSFSRLKKRRQIDRDALLIAQERGGSAPRKFRSHLKIRSASLFFVAKGIPDGSIAKRLNCSSWRGCVLGNAP